MFDWNIPLKQCKSGISNYGRGPMHVTKKPGEIPRGQTPWTARQRKSEKIFHQKYPITIYINLYGESIFLKLKQNKGENVPFLKSFSAPYTFKL